MVQAPLRGARRRHRFPALLSLQDLRVVIDHLRASGKVSTIALWGRSMGAATALLHGDRDPSIAAMVRSPPVRRALGAVAPTARFLPRARGHDAEAPRARAPLSSRARQVLDSAFADLSQLAEELVCLPVGWWDTGYDCTETSTQV